MKYPHPFLYLLLLITPEAFSASPTWYEVEILVFEHLTPNTRDPEIIPLESRPLNSERLRGAPSIQANAPAQTPRADPLPLLPRAWKLTDIVQRLNKSSHYRSLLHQAWKQIALSPRQASPIFLHLPFPENNTPDDSLDPQLEGTIALSRGRFLHLALNLLYRHPAKAAALSESEIDPSNLPPRLSKLFHLTESRRIRIQELHYFDHPRFGVLAQVRQSAAPAENAPGAPKTFPLEATSAQEISPKEAGQLLKPEE